VVIARINGAEDRTAIEALKGKRLYVARDVLPETEDEEEFYHADLVGITVVYEQGKECGTVTAIYDFGAGDMVDMCLLDGRAVLIPFTAAAVPTVDVSARRLVVAAEALAATDVEQEDDP
jgi:16S rRNA processing protein RimM